MCVFCKIIAKEIPAYVIKENEMVLAFLDINPVHPGHILVVPKKHFANLEELEGDYLEAVMLMIKEMGFLIKEKLKADSYNVILNNDKAAGQEIAHLHFHLIPRVEGDGLKSWPHKEYQTGEAEEVLKKLQS